MASGQIGNELKFFFYSQTPDKSGTFLIETLVNQQTKLLTANIKTTRPELANSFINNFVSGFETYIQSKWMT